MENNKLWVDSLNYQQIIAPITQTVVHVDVNSSTCLARHDIQKYCQICHQFMMKYLTSLI